MQIFLLIHVFCDEYKTMLKSKAWCVKIDFGTIYFYFFTLTEQETVVSAVSSMFFGFLFFCFRITTNLFYSFQCHCNIRIRHIQIQLNKMLMGFEEQYILFAQYYTALNTYTIIYLYTHIHIYLHEHTHILMYTSYVMQLRTWIQGTWNKCFVPILLGNLSDCLFNYIKTIKQQ